jgi:hypothetical protein
MTERSPPGEASQPGVVVQNPFNTTEPADLGLGVDNLLRTEHQKLKLRFSVIYLTNTEALYNFFLSTFSGSHFVTPRAYQLQVGWTF